MGARYVVLLVAGMTLATCGGPEGQAPESPGIAEAPLEPPPPLDPDEPLPDGLAAIAREVAGVPESPARTPKALSRLLLEGAEPEYRVYEVVPGTKTLPDPESVLTVGRFGDESFRGLKGTYQWYRSEAVEAGARVVMFEATVPQDVREKGNVAAREIPLEPGEHAGLVRLAASLRGWDLRKRERHPMHIALFGFAWYLVRTEAQGLPPRNEEFLGIRASTPMVDSAVPSMIADVMAGLAGARSSREHAVDDRDREWLKACFADSVATRNEERFTSLGALRVAYGVLFDAFGLKVPPATE